MHAENIPQGYYDAAIGLSNAALKDALHQTIHGGYRYTYGTNSYQYKDSVASIDSIAPDGSYIFHKGDTLWHKGDIRSLGTWYGFIQTDRLSNGCVWDMYSSTMHYFPKPGESAAGLNIEHCLPKSWWGGSENEAYTDLYLLNPADQVANNNKSNYPPGILADTAKFNNGMFFMGKDTTWGGYAFTVCDEYKGDFARTYFYVATAYQHLDWATNYKAYIDTKSYLTLTPYLTNVLLQWHRADPVSQKEIDRLDAISTIQHNRNPFIEYPDLVEMIWGDRQGEAFNPTTLVRTTSSSYIVPYDTINPVVYPATDVYQDHFTASWKDQKRSSYCLDVFTIVESGTNDTLVALPHFNRTHIESTYGRAQWLLEDGSKAPYTLMDGSCAVSLSTTTNKRQIRFSNFGKAPANTYLTIRCCIYRGDNSADIVIRGDNDSVLYTQTLTANETYYTFPIPAGTERVSVIQKEIGSKKTGYHRISFQQAYLYAGDYTVTNTSLYGFPMTLTETSYQVKHSEPAGQTIYYNITPQGLRTSNTIITTVPPNTDDITTITSPSNRTHKVFINGQLYIIRQEQVFDLLGRQH